MLYKLARDLMFGFNFIGALIGLCREYIPNYAFMIGELSVAVLIFLSIIVMVLTYKTNQN